MIVARVRLVAEDPGLVISHGVYVLAGHGTFGAYRL